MSTDIKLSKAQMSKIIRSVWFLCNILGNLDKKKNLAIRLAIDSLPRLVSNLDSNAINKFQWKTSRKGAAREEKQFTLFILNEDMHDTIKIIKSLEVSNILIDGITETVKHEIKNKKVDFLLLC